MKTSFSAIFAIFWGVSLSLIGCDTLHQMQASRAVDNKLRKSEVFNQQFTGFVLFDPESKTFLKNHNGDLYFTPASNTKILTTYACLTSLGDSIPTFRVITHGDTLLLSPYGDPTLLHPDFPVQPVLPKISQHPLQITLPTTPLDPLGPGWAWDDYQFSFQSERSWLPLYGNEVRIFNRDSLQVVPFFFRHFVNKYVGEKPGNMINRELHFNLFNVWMESDTASFERKIPYLWSRELATILLEDTLHQPVAIYPEDRDMSTGSILYNQRTLSTLALMMQRSDNFLAEQLLAVSARASGYSNLDAFRQHLITQWQLPAPIRWVDGSGLSRYNLISPVTFALILDHIYDRLSWQDIQWIFPNGGSSGTLRNWFGGNPTYVFAKTGTLSNNYCVSGYLITQSGRTLIFSFMNNHYLTNIGTVKQEIQTVLESIRDHY